jgi:hypothetical protein
VGIAILLLAWQEVSRTTPSGLVTELQKPDAKKRLSIGQAVEEPAGAYNVYRNALGQIMLDPVKAIPVYEAWLFENQGRPSSSDA